MRQANALRCAMRTVPRTRYVFSIQEDTALRPPIDTPLIHSLLATDPDVEYVKFSWHDDCVEDAATGRLHHEQAPCTRHAQSALLHRIGFWSDRPHFATREAYERRVFPLLQPTARLSPEQLFVHRAPRERGLWLYGRRGDMHHDLHLGTGGSSYDVYAYHELRYRHGKGFGG